MATQFYSGMRGPEAIQKLNDLYTTAGNVGTAAADAAAAAASAAQAAASAAASASVYDGFDDRYLGAKASAPQVDNDGNTLVTGAMYFNSTNNIMYVRTATSTWVANTDATQATAAATSASAASTQASSAATSATAAGTSATSAATQATSAGTSATNASTQATAATTQATNAASQATAASTSATNAATSATTATTQATNAAASATAAAASYDSFDDRYLGSKATAPTVDNDGNTILVGAEYFNSTTQEMYVRTSSNTWVTVSNTATSTAAATQATNAASQATAANTSATNAATSATTATTQATSASTSATNAASQATSAGTSATSAATQATSAGTSATTASTQATAATTSATNAAAQATQAGNSATSASTSATTATTQAAAALASKNLAADWAEKATEVEPGKFSAKYWAGQAAASSTGQLVYRGQWQAAGAAYPATPQLGDYYKISVAGTIGGTNFSVNDSIIYNGTSWDKIDNTEDTSPILDHQDFNTAAASADQVARLKWNDGDGTLEVGLKGGNVTLQVGQEQVARIYNNTGATITNGQVVYITGQQGNRPSVALASNQAESTSQKTVGIATENILNAAEGFVTTSGLVRGLNTQAYAEGTTLWLGGTAGSITSTKPAAPAHQVLLGWVTRQHATTGTIFVHIANGYELNELHDVLITAPVKGQGLIHDGSVWKNAGYNDNYPTIRPSLNLDFANSQTVDPRITFTRASTATYYDGKTFAKAEENLLLQSQVLGTAWTTTAASITSDAVVAPDGTTTADTLTADGTTSNHDVRQVTSGFGATGDKTYSIYAKAGTGNFIQLGNVGSSSVYANFDLSTGTIGTVGASNTAAIVSAGNGWYRCAITTAATSLTSATVVIIENGTSVRGQSWATSNTIYLWGAQLEQRSTVTAYTATTTAPITRYVPKLMTAVSGAPRIDYDPVTLACKGLLIEEARTNLLTYSEELVNAAWTKAVCTITPNAAVAPGGEVTMGKMVVNSTASSSGAYATQTITKAATATTYTLSYFLKAAEKDGFRLYMRDTATSANYAAVSINLTTGTAGTPASGGTFTSPVVSVVAVGGGIFRCSLTLTTGTETSCVLRSGPMNGDGTSFTGDGTSGIYIWGAQLEAGAFPTSYIPTTTAAATRAADVAVMTGTNFSSWYRQDEGTFVVEASTSYPQAVAGVVFAASDGTTNNRIQMAFGSSVLTPTVTTATVGQVSGLTEPASIANAFYKLVLGYKENDFAMSVGGSAVDTDTVGLVPIGVTQIQIGHRTTWLNGNVRSLRYYPKRLSNAELQTITTA